MNEITKIPKTEYGDIMIFKTKYGDLRAIIKDNEPWFVAVDICKALKYKNSRKAVKDNCKDYGVTHSYITDGLGRKQLTQIINEPNLYRLVVKSTLPAAVEFEREVFDGILPSIRKKGYYSVRPQLTAEQEDKIIFAEQISTCEGDIDVQRFAEILSKGDFKIGRTELFRWLREHKYVMKAKNRINRPYQKYISAGYFKVGAEYTVNSKNETVRKIKVYITPLGQLALTSKIIKSFLPPITKYQIKLF